MKSILFLLLTVLVCSSCHKTDVPNNSDFTILGNTYGSVADNDEALHAWTISDGIKTLRLYYSDSLNDLEGTPRIVNFSKMHHLDKDECYLEINLSVDDTYLSTGYDNKRIEKVDGNYLITDARVQHFNVNSPSLKDSTTAKASIRFLSL
jgi:hypothetical protein